MTRACLTTLGCLALAVPQVFAQTGSLAGRVTSEADRPIAAVLGISALGLRAETDASGRFRFAAVPTGTHEVRVTAPGFVEVRRRVVVEAGRETSLVVALASAVVALDEVVVRGVVQPGSVRPAEDRSGPLITAGVKSEIVQVAGLPANLAEKTGRLVFARVPGVFVYDMDGSGNQINISTRGLDAHRSWELNVRQDGVMVNSDIYGYPASHYSLPLEAVERVENIRGTAALQYGAQFGGLINYVTKRPDTTRAVSGQLLTSTGAYGLWSGYGAAGGKVGNVTWQGYGSVRGSDGYRPNAKSEYNAQYLAATIPLGTDVSLRAQVGRTWYRYRIPGPLTDAMFEADPRTSTRSRNWFSPDITVPALRLNWKLDDATDIQVQASGVFGSRSSVQFLGFANVPDVPNQSGEFAARQVDIDNFKSMTAELRVNRSWTAFSLPATLAVGVAVSNNDLRRRQQGRGTSGADYDLTLSTGDFGRDIHYKTKAMSAYLENMFRVSDRWTVVPGLRVEHGRTRMTGRLAYYDPANVPTSISHKFPLFGVRSEYHLGPALEAYGGWSQAYRPMILKDVLPENALERPDPNLKDAKGWTMEGGVRGRIGGTLSFDLSAFLLRYNDRFGTVLQTEGTTTYVFKTNVGSSDTKGIELSANLPVLTTSAMAVSAFTATSYFDGRYRKGTVASGGQNRSIVGNRIEAVPKWISRSGLGLVTGSFSGSVTLSHVGHTFADPLNTVQPSANGAVGEVPAYTLVDLGASVTLTQWLRLQGGLSNVLDRKYFTKRPSFYPGPGIWPSDGRGFHVALDVRP